MFNSYSLTWNHPNRVDSLCAPNQPLSSPGAIWQNFPTYLLPPVAHWNMTLDIIEEG
jgi:hypothetical protein